SHDQIGIDCPHFAQPYHLVPSADPFEKNGLKRTAMTQILVGARVTKCGSRAANLPVSCACRGRAPRREKISEARAGGESGIRTHDTVSRIHAFQACALSHSAISPAGLR